MPPRSAGAEVRGHVEDVAGAAYEAEHLGDVHCATRPGVGEQLAELRPLERVEVAGGARILLEGDRVTDPGLVQEEVLAGRSTAGRSRPACRPGSPLVGPFRMEDWSLSVVKPCQQSDRT
ncbi:predicted protein [Streptomyces viridochromogenes DSM 40736]|uniref:Predicted protein n=1 Tax=Streptomyces viridochromogenes (strain DSM 40736 / JCM 4977 / BCRC 1201 / Tue 494) TaxID=591159 RepID=D9XHW6_STRVT|nr:predicted protein [Streptomyces viridochromogenes DSM 40736]